jgi:hypothetical protein
VTGGHELDWRGKLTDVGYEAQRGLRKLGRDVCRVWRRQGREGLAAKQAAVLEYLDSELSVEALCFFVEMTSPLPGLRRTMLKQLHSLSLFSSFGHRGPRVRPTVKHRIANQACFRGVCIAQEIAVAGHNPLFEIDVGEFHKKGEWPASYSPNSLRCSPEEELIRALGE